MNKTKNRADSFRPIAILGAGSWGTALALYLGRRGQTVKLWSIEEQEIALMCSTRMNQRYLPGHVLPPSIYPTTLLAQAVQDVEDILIVVPSAGFRQTLTALKPLLQTPAHLICASKGMDAATNLLLHQVAEEVLGPVSYAVLSGPSFAREVAAGLPAALVLAGKNADFVKRIRQRFDSELFQIETSDDVIGVEIGGVVKNVIAIATGISDGMQAGANARSALITRGLAEMMRLGQAMGGKTATFIGLAGLGDLILTCSDDQSRNRRLGLALGKGQDIQAAEQAIGQVVEGKENARLVVKLAAEHNVSLPLCSAVWSILQGQITVQEAGLHGRSG